MRPPRKAVVAYESRDDQGEGGPHQESGKREHGDRQGEAHERLRPEGDAVEEELSDQRKQVEHEGDGEGVEGDGDLEGAVPGDAALAAGSDAAGETATVETAESQPGHVGDQDGRDRERGGAEHQP